MRVINLVALVLFSSPLVNANSSVNIQFESEKYQLKNGLTVILHQNRKIPIVSYHTWYRVGSVNESPGVTGAAHMLEHMMFKGAEKYDGKQFDQILHAKGITNNAFTSYDYTGFYANLPPKELELMMDLEVDRMKSLALRAEDLKSELQVVGEERRWRLDNNPPGLLQQEFLSTLMKGHPYEWPVIGWMEDIQQYTVEKLRPFYQNYYSPNNAVLVIAGDFDKNKAKKLIEKNYSQLKARPLPESKIEMVKPITSTLRKEIFSQVQSTSVMLGFSSPSSLNSDTLALDLLAMHLSSGNSSPLSKVLRYEKRLVNQVSAYNYSNRYGGAFMIMAELNPGVKPQDFESQVLKIINSEISKLKDLDLLRGKNQLLKSSVDVVGTIDKRAQILAWNEILFGDHERFFKDLSLSQQLTAEDLKRVGNKYLVRKNFVRVDQLPLKNKPSIN